MSVLGASWRRWLALALMAVLLGAVFVRLGFWQLARAHRPHSVSSATVALSQVSVLGQALPEASVGTSVSATGQYDGSHELLIHRQNGQTWVLTPLLLPDGAALAVVRGLAPATPPPSGQVQVTGLLEASEPPTAGSSTSPVVVVNTEYLVSHWPYSIHDGYLVLVRQSPASALPTAPAPARIAGGLRLLNLIYAIQWWIFAAFAQLFVAKIIRDDVVAAHSTREATD